MPRPKKPTFEYVERLGRYRKRIKDTDGKYVAVYGRTPEELTRKLAAAEAEIAASLRRAGDVTVREYVERWIALNAPGMKHKYRESTVNALRGHVVPVIGDMALSDVRQEDAQRVMNAISDKSDSLNAKVRQTMRKLFEAARANGLIAANPCVEIRHTGKKRRRIDPLKPQQVDRLLDAVSGTPAETFVRLALYAGLRREEACGLRWGCVDLDADVPCLTVARTVTWESNRPVISDELKTDAAYRTIPIPAQLVDHLKAICLSEADFYVLTASKFPPTQSQWRNIWRYVRERQAGQATYWGKDANGRPKKMTFERKLGAKSRGAAFSYSLDFPVTPHQLRHTYCSNLVLSGANVKRVQYLMGHADIRVTLDIYAALVENSPAALIGDVNLAFGVKSEVKKESNT